MDDKKWLIAFIGIAVLIKIFLFGFAQIHAPQSKFAPDSYLYLNTAKVLVTKGAFAWADTNGALHEEYRRTPGYPLFLGVLNGLWGIPLSGVVFIQVLLTISAAFFVFKTANEIDPDPRLVFLSAGLILYSPNITVYSLKILTETLFLLLMTLYMFNFVRYLKTGAIKYILVTSCMLVLAAYVRPGAYFLGYATAGFVIYANAARDMRRTLYHAIVFLVIMYGLLGIWQLRNYVLFHDAAFTKIFIEYNHFYTGPSGKIDLVGGVISQMDNYRSTIGRDLLSIMTRPGSLKYFDCPAITILGKILGYPLVMFWMAGLLLGITKIGRNIYFQFLLFALICILYGSIVAGTHYAGERFRVPMEPFIAIISAFGWQQLILNKRNRLLGTFGRCELSK